MVRLVAAGLREAGKVVCAKTTGTLARMILPDGRELPVDRYRVDDTSLTLLDPPPQFVLDTEVEIAPESNTALEGLYTSNGMFCTQCEAEGFRDAYPERFFSFGLAEQNMVGFAAGLALFGGNLFVTQTTDGHVLQIQHIHCSTLVTAVSRSAAALDRQRQAAEPQRLDHDLAVTDHQRARQQREVDPPVLEQRHALAELGLEVQGPDEREEPSRQSVDEAERVRYRQFRTVTESRKSRRDGRV